MPPTQKPPPRSGIARQTKPAIVREFASGAILGGLIWGLISTLGFPGIFHLSRASGFAPSLLLGGLLGLSRYYLLLWIIGGGLTALYGLVAFTPLIIQPARALIRSDPMPSPPLTLDAVVVLSGGVSRDGLLSPDATDRLFSGLRLAKATRTPALVTTRVRNPANPEISSDADQKRLVELVGPRSQLFIVSDVFSTRDEALRVRDLAAQQQWARVAVVTSPAHSRRACGTFEKAGLRVTCVPSESRDVAFKTLATADDRLKAFRLWIYEMAGTVNYRLKGWLP